MISLTLDERTEKLRTEFLSWLESNPPPKSSGRQELAAFVDISRAWQQKLAAERWVGVHWPEKYGGRGLSIVEEAVIQECLAGAGAPQLINLFGLTMVGPVLIEHGTDAQRERFLPKILSADEIWCQGFSEPEAGSDLAAVKTKAVRTASGWSLSGQKVWTSFAQVADWCFILARSDASAKRYDGLTYFLFSMKNPGISVRPLTQISGDKEFNELFLENVPVSEGDIVGAEGEGWKIAISTLMYERVVLTFARHLQSENALNEIRDLLRDRGASESEKRELGRLIAKSMAVRALALSHLTSYSSPGSDRRKAPGPEGSLDKLGWSETYQEICKFAVSLLGEQSILERGPESFKDGLFQHDYLYSRGRTIAAGTSEIQRNIIAERILGLPREGK
ncbi:MAG: acyl-CoA dehydrogenase family protein [Bdellovibrionota bacterium]